MIRSIAALSDYDNGSGVCRYLADNLCAIYQTRPQICRVEEMYEIYFKPDMAWEQFIALNTESCEKIALIMGDADALQKIRDIAR
jgi:Fe-S-cluster containining protein